MNKYFYDLHIHSCLSPCSDNDMTPNNIAGMSAIKGLNIVALTDHNSCKNCPAFFEAAKRNGIIPVAGMELTTAEDIHLVCLFEHLDEAMDFDSEISKHTMKIENRPDIFGDQLILNSEDEIIGTENNLLLSSTDLLIDDAIKLSKQFGAHVHPAHIDRESNGIIAILGDVPLEYGFEFVEFNSKDNITSYFSQYKSLENSDVLVCSDAHHLWDISEQENFIELDDEPYSSSYVRKKLFEKLFRTNY